jgi:hypothetical protein
MIDEADLRRMTREERARLARALAALDLPAAAPDPGALRRRRLIIAAAISGAVVLGAWIGVLAVTLPPRYRAGGWNAAWIGFDGMLLIIFLATAWSAWKRRQLLILCLVVLATLLCCDAWFDTALDYGTRGFMISLLSALLIELPVALAALIGARRLLRLTLRRIEALGGATGPLPPFWKVPLFGDARTGYRHLLTAPGKLASGAGPEPSTTEPSPASH